MSRPPAPDAGPKPPVGGRQGEGRPRLALPGDLPLSLSYLNDDQFDSLLRATTAEARRRGWKVGEVRPAARVREERATSRRSPGADAAAGRTAAISPGQEKIVRAALEAGVKPADIARQFGLSRALVQHLAAAWKRER